MLYLRLHFGTTEEMKLVENALSTCIVQLHVKNILVCAGTCTHFYTWSLGFKLLNLKCFDMERAHLPAIAEVNRIAQVKKKIH